MPNLALFAGYVIVVFIGLLGLLVLFNIVSRRIDLKLLISEKDGAASLSRFQFLIFTFVIGMCLLILTIDSGEFPRLDANILGLLGISGGSYVIAKGIQRSKDETTHGGGGGEGGESDEAEREILDTEARLQRLRQLRQARNPIKRAPE